MYSWFLRADGRMERRTQSGRSKIIRVAGNNGGLYFDNRKPPS